MTQYYNTTSPRYFELVRQPVIYPMVKVLILDHEENVLNEITQDISSDSGSITCNYKQGVRRSCNITFADPEGKYIPNANKSLFWIRSKFKIFNGLKDVNNGDIYWFSQGVFYVNDSDASHDGSKRIVSLNGVDKFGIFGSEMGFNQLEGTYLIETGTNAYMAIKSILNLDLGNGQVIDPVSPILDIKFKDTVLPYDIIKSPGQYLADILIEIANVLGANIYYNNDGKLVVESGTTDLSYAIKPSIYDFTDVLPEYMSSKISYNFSDVINSVKVIGNNLKGVIVSYTAENINPLSPTRIGLIGRKAAQPIETTNITTEEQAKTYAKFVLNRLSIVQLAVDFSCSMIPHLCEDAVISITDSFYKYNRERFIIQSITIPLNVSGAMNISASNIASLPYYEHTSA